jgi:hypothetical protein
MFHQKGCVSQCLQFQSCRSLTMTKDGRQYASFVQLKGEFPPKDDMQVTGHIELLLRFTDLVVIIEFQNCVSNLHIYTIQIIFSRLF